MDPLEFGRSTLPLQHAPYGPITPESLATAIAGKVALVTGAAHGIGAAIAQSLALSGAHVALLDLVLFGSTSGWGLQNLLYPNKQRRNAAKVKSELTYHDLKTLVMLRASRRMKG
ncbi:hypothetical protein BDV95DRAFT_569420 [Massariosphaeria phaeospora]|uniref:NAD(P)-binding protein n=1 Tax=Massariosphaeria phaeospora TaxID=100035 RepID=A0A7C8MCY5_9PLEO|nr:hypothetical protein BDV95DRAFT_569420 [Massariosphaeria phaeospora]